MILGKTLLVIKRNVNVENLILSYPLDILPKMGSKTVSFT